MNFVWWIVSVLATLAALKFVMLVFRRLTSKENMNLLIDRANNGLHTAADKAACYFEKRKKQKRKGKRNKNQPIVTIR